MVLLISASVNALPIWGVFVSANLQLRPLTLANISTLRAFSVRALLTANHDSSSKEWQAHRNATEFANILSIIQPCSAAKCPYRVLFLHSLVARSSALR